MNQTNLVQRLADRLRSGDLGDLLTDDDLKQVCAQAIERAFFAQREIKDGWTTKEAPPLIVEVVRDALQETVRQEVRDWMATHADKLADYWKQVLDQGLLQYVEAEQNRQATEHLRRVLRNTFDQINVERSRRGDDLLLPAF